ncbi:MAG TPA: SMP-30/gluconolactonase/LRE family protein [Rhizomicrobium sp.]|jgi:gluconolactonase|nr:SMP-30/gluconolactonase/LRE family protein [Rhizomicrobium sp.]
MPQLTRRAAVAGASALAPAAALAQTGKAMLATPPSVITNPPRDWSPNAPPDVYPDPDIVVVDPAFRRLLVNLSAIHRLGTGFKWTEGPAWSGEGQYIVFSDVQGDAQYRYLWDAKTIVPFRVPSFYSNGNTFDFQGRQVSCQDFFRRLVRWELDGSMTVLTDNYQGKPLNSPNDVAPHPDGSIWFTDPSSGDSLSEGHPDAPGGMANPDGLFDPKLGNSGAGLYGATKRVLPHSIYRWDPSGKLDLVIPSDLIPGPNGLCFSPDYKTLYVISTQIYVFDVVGQKVTGKRLFTDCMVDGVYCHPDGMRADRAGNVWASSNAPLGYSGSTCWSPAGKLLGRLRLPETASNVCFAGPKRNHLFITAAQSVYMVPLNIQGAAPG